MNTMDDYRGFKITPGFYPEPNWFATHPDYDASYEGPEDGWVDNGLFTYADTLEDLRHEVDAIIDEHPHFQDKQS